MHSPILSVYNATYNRKEIIIAKINNLLKINSEEFDIFVLDDCSDDGTFGALQSIKDNRLHISQNEERQGLLKDRVLNNWYRLLEMCDGLFAFHLNDRDLIDLYGLQKLMVFSKRTSNRYRWDMRKKLWRRI